MKSRILFFVILLISTHIANAGPSYSEPTKEQIRNDLDLVINKLDKINFLPNLLPLIIDNKDFIGLTDKQADVLVSWRNTNRTPLLAKMNEVANKRIEIKQTSLSPTVSSRQIQMQNEIFRLQREVVDYKLSCREMIITTFDEENWISLFMVLADEDSSIKVPLNYADAQRLQDTDDYE